MKQPLFFRIYKNGQLSEIKQIQSTQVVLGANEDVEVSLKDESVSPIHAMVEERESGYFICDLGSSSGTKRNGESVLDAQIESGDEIQIGAFTIEFYVGVPKPKSKPPKVGETLPPPAKVEKDAIYDSALAPTSVAKPKVETPKVEAVTKPTPAPAPKAPTPITTPAPKKVEIPVPVAKVQKPEGVVHSLSEQMQVKPASFQKVETPRSSGIKGKSHGGLEAHGGLSNRKGHWGEKTFAPPSVNRSLKDSLKPTKGTVVEIVVAWKERILGTYHYDNKKTVTVGSHPKNDIVLPVFGSSTVSHPLVKVEGSAKVFLTSDLRGELVSGSTSTPLSEVARVGRAESSGAGTVVTLQQGELIRIDFADMVSIYIRYVAQAPKPIAAPFLGLTSSEITTVLGSLILTLFIGLYFAVYAPQEVIEDKKEEEPPRRAVFMYKSQIEPVTSPEEVKKPSPEAKLADKTTPKQEKAPVKTDKPQKAASKDDEGKASEAKPNKSKSQEIKLTTPNPGKNTGIQKAGANNNKKNDAAGASAQKDVSKMGMLSVLSGKGMQDKISQVNSGAGIVGGLSQTATGSGSSSAAGAGDTPGEGLKNIGKGGNGEATVGISGVNTKGRGSGNQGYGTGSIGDKKNATVIPGGAEESFEGTIDRDAIRRVVQENMRQIKACYERALNKDPALHGKVVMSWVLNDKGRVTAASVSSTTMNSSEVEQCMISRLRTWQFPATPKGQEADITYPFAFAAQN